MSYNGPLPIGIIEGGTNTNGFGTVSGIVVFDGIRLVNYPGPQIDSSGIMTNSTQPVFSAYLTTTLTNVTGDGTVFTIPFDTTISNVGGSYNVATGLFTAPVLGNYIFTYTIYTTTTSVWGTMNPISSFSLSGSAFYNVIGKNLTTTDAMLNSSLVLPLNVGDTVGVNLTSTNVVSALNTSIVGSSSARYATFSGYLLC